MGQTRILSVVLVIAIGLLIGVGQTSGSDQARSTQGRSGQVHTASLSHGRPVPVSDLSLNQPAGVPGSPQFIQQAYDLTALSASSGYGDTVAIIAIGSGYAPETMERDLAAFRSYYQLPACDRASGCLRIVDQTGGQSFSKGNYSHYDYASAWEAAIDLDAVSTSCPNCRLLVVEAPTAFDGVVSDLGQAEATAYKLGAQQISNSLGTIGGVRDQFVFRGAATLAASGDYGYLGSGQFGSLVPAGLPGVTAVGGTTLTPSSTPSTRGVNETAWEGSGSGCTRLLKPAWQPETDGCSYRATTDISADADPATGLDAFCSYCDRGNNDDPAISETWGGTSLATPLVAGYYGLLSRLQLGVGQVGPAWAYQDQASLNDVISGNNGQCPVSLTTLCNAGPGWDGPTGNGSITGALVQGAPGVSRGVSCSSCTDDPGSFVVSSNANSVQLSGGVYPNGLPTTYQWEYGPTASLGQSTAPVSVGSGTAPVQVSDVLAGIEPWRNYHFRLVASNPMGTVSYGGVDGYTVSVSQRFDLSPLTDLPPQATVLYATPNDHKVEIGYGRQARRISFAFASNQIRAHFKCSLNTAAFTSCVSPARYLVGKGNYVFKVRASTKIGGVLKTGLPDTYKVRVGRLDNPLAPCDPRVSFSC